ncbi:Homeobox protein engrailed [Operophtera brumata]|uniref:Homeobox protein engrailed n=1 Tax=Operophtera brumata TaxID=104452 RepID=A0A0L7L0G9_OPEBR|nr:Homeobox protein engrailed [Operophtera brumata]
MAFEDRCSPNQGTSPGPVLGRVPAPHGMNQQYYPPSQYTCTTIDSRYERTPSMTLVKVQPNSPPPSPNSNEGYQNYYRPETPDVKPQISEQRFENKQPSAPVAFSISNILHPEFGLNALRKTNKIEGPKSVGPNHSILYKPYDLSKQQNGSSVQFQKYNFDYLKSKESNDFNPLPPLGGLRQTVSQIGESREREQPKVVEAQKRPDSASSMVSSTSSGALSNCGSTDTNSQSGNPSLWPAWETDRQATSKLK